MKMRYEGDWDLTVERAAMVIAIVAVIAWAVWATVPQLRGLVSLLQ
jgi:hypothetical protein